MSMFFSNLPIVDLKEIAPPTPGTSDGDVDFCRQKFAEDDKCRQHYEAISQRASGYIYQCPHGFSSYCFQLNGKPHALTSFIPYPRQGGARERLLSKKYPQKKISAELVAEMATRVIDSVRRLSEIEKAVATQQSMALHEIRKLNRTVKQTAERLSLQHNSLDANQKSQIDSIWKASELMSGQFDVLELIANEDLAKLPCVTISEPFKVFHKLARIYMHGDPSCKIQLNSEANYYPAVAVCDKTFPILASVLLSNATKYKIPNSDIKVDFLPLAGAPERLKIVISNLARNAPNLDRRIFEKGYRVAQDSDGTGKGLYLAQLVAKQHGSKLEFFKDRSNFGNDVVQVTFTLILNVIST